jgi:hypothetical protein
VHVFDPESGENLTLADGSAKRSEAETTVQAVVPPAEEGPTEDAATDQPGPTAANRGQAPGGGRS